MYLFQLLNELERSVEEGTYIVISSRKGLKAALKTLTNPTICLISKHPKTRVSRPMLGSTNYKQAKNV